MFLAKGINRAKPHVKKWWEESVRPFVSDYRARLFQPRSKRASKASSALFNLSLHAKTSDQIPSEVTISVSRPRMSNAEAQARYLAAMAAHAFSEEQMRLVRSADIIDADGVAEIETRIAELPPNDVHELMSRMVADPSLLNEETLAELASVLARVSRPTPSESRQLPQDLG